MEKLLCILLSLAFTIGLAGCSTAASACGGEASSTTAVSQMVPSVAQSPSQIRSAGISSIEGNNMLSINLQIGDKNFSATLINSESAQAFVNYFPMTVSMSDLNGQEKFYDLPEDLPATATERPSTIHSGEIMGWSGNTLVLFYSTFQNSYGGYVRLGTVDDPEGLAQALGSGSNEVTWTLTT